jgi:hypothetical protein
MTNDQILNHFIETWPLDRVRTMSLEEYNKVGSKDTFCYMLEYGTKNLGNISGNSPSTKFEIFERKDRSKTPISSDYGFDDKYTWRNRGGYKKSREEAFEYTKGIITQIIESSLNKDFRAIDGKKLAPLIVWKIAFLYSNKKLLAISDRKATRHVASLLGMRNYSKARISAVHKFIMQSVNATSFWQEMEAFWECYKNRSKTGFTSESKSFENLIRKKGVTQKDIFDSLHIRSKATITITKEHNKLQELLHAKLLSQFGEEAVSMEENNIDIKVELHNCIDFYEVKIASSAKYCIREALGQIIEYAYNYNTSKVKNLIIVGNHRLTEEDGLYMNFLTDLLSDMKLKYQFEAI